MLAVRVAGGAVIAIALVVGVAFSGKIERDSRARVAGLSAAAPTAAEANADVRQRKQRAAFDESAFVAGAEQDAARFGVSAEKAGAVANLQAHLIELQEPVILAAGKSWRGEHLEISAAVDKVAFQKLGATVSARHTLALVKNISDVPVAYNARIRSQERGKCEVRGVRMHNAMALMPGDAAEIVICAGSGKIRIDRAEVLEISELGFHYLSRVSPRAVGQDSGAASAHRAPGGTSMCDTVDSSGLSRAIRDGLVRWVDVADYYSRHACDRFRFFDTYRYTADKPARLPAQPQSP